MSFYKLISSRMIDGCSYKSEYLDGEVSLKSPNEKARRSSINQMSRYQYSYKQQFSGTWR